MSAIAAQFRKPMSGAGTEPVTIVGFVKSPGDILGVFIDAAGRLNAGELDRFSDCRVDRVEVVPERPPVMIINGHIIE